MAYEKPTREPVEIEAGTSLIFERSLADYPADSWTLSYSLRNATAAPIDITATQSGTTQSYLVSESTATTASWTAGTYWMVGYVSDGTERHRVYEGKVKIHAYVAGKMAYEWRSYARQMLDLVEDQIRTGVSRNVISYSLNGRSFTIKSDADLLNARNYFRAEVRSEEAKGRQRKVLVRFR